MVYYLVIHSGYKEVEFGLYHNNSLLSYKKDESKKVSTNFINIVENMLKSLKGSSTNLKLTSKLELKYSKQKDVHNSELVNNLSFIAAHQGPGPFTTLRVILAFLNGLNFTTNIPLIGVNGLKAILAEYSSEEHVTIALLNAFSNDLYFGIKEPGNEKISFGYDNAIELLNQIKLKCKNKIKFIGNGVNLFKENINQLFANQAIIPKHIPELASLQSIASIAYNSFKNNQNISNELIPLYLKDITVNVKLK